MRIARRVLWTAPLWACAPAAAHAPIDGLGSFYNGLLHPLFVPAHLLALLALGLCLGQHAAMRIRFILPAYGGAIVLGLLIAAWLPALGSETALLGAAAALGLLVALAPRLPASALMALTLLTGLLAAMDSRMEGLGRTDTGAGLFGSGISLYLLPLYPMVLAEACQYKWGRPWQRIAVRVAGSWIAASALLVLSLSFSSTRI